MPKFVNEKYIEEKYGSGNPMKREGKYVCPKCQSNNTCKNGFLMIKKIKKQRIMCYKCGTKSMINERKDRT